MSTAPADDVTGAVPYSYRDPSDAYEAAPEHEARPTIDEDGEKHAVVLSGGSSQGAYHVGVLRALFHGESPATNYKPLRPVIFSGTSAGAFNAAVILGQIEAENPHPAEYLEETWLSRIARTGTSCGNGVYRWRGNPLPFFDLGCLIENPLRPFLDLIDDANFFTLESVRRGRQFISSTESLTKRLVDQVNVSTFVTTDRFRQAIEESIPFDLIHHSKRLIRVGAVTWGTGGLHYFTNQDMTVDVGPRILLASAAIPGLFPRAFVNGVPYGDGGVIENAPLQGAMEADSNVMHVVSSFPRARNIPPESVVNTLDTLYRMLVINVSKSIQRDIERVRNINDAILVLEYMAEDGIKGRSYDKLRDTLDRILNKSKLPPRRMTVHVHMPAEPTANLVQYVDFGREYLQELVRKGYYDSVTHNCRANGCVLPEEET